MIRWRRLRPRTPALRLPRSRRAGVVALLLVLAGTAAVLLLAGEGGSPSLSEARTGFINACANGEGNQKPLCACTAQELERKHGYKTGARFERTDAALRAGRNSTAVDKALAVCAQRFPPPPTQPAGGGGSG